MERQTGGSDAQLRQQQEEFQRRLLRPDRTTQDAVTPDQASAARPGGTSPWELLNSLDARTRQVGQWNLQTPQG